MLGFAKLSKRRLREVIGPALAGGAPNVQRALDFTKPVDSKGLLHEIGELLTRGTSKKVLIVD